MLPLLPFLCLLLLLAFVLRADVLFSVLWLAGGLYVGVRLWTRHGSRHLTVHRDAPTHAFHGDVVSVDVRVRNTGHLPIPWLEIQENIPFELQDGSSGRSVITLRRAGQQRIRYTLRCRRRGAYTLGPLTVRSGDILGIEERQSELARTRSIIVYPRLVPLEHLGLPATSALVTLPSRSPLFEDTSRLAGVREYRQGDSLRGVHWPATARIGKLVVKQYQPAITRETMICLDICLEHYPSRRHDALEQAIVVAASLLHHIVSREKLPAGLAMDGNHEVDGQLRRVYLSPSSGQAHLLQGLEALAQAQPVVGDLSQMLAETSSALPWGATMLAITGRLDPDLARSLLALTRRGFSVGVVLVQPQSAIASESTGLGGVRVHRVWTDDELVAAI